VGAYGAAAPPAWLLVPAGAIAGLDGPGALKLAGLNRVTHTSTEPPFAWRGTPAERILPLDALRKRTALFAGSAREAALNYPRKANFAATVALAGLGFDRTRVHLDPDPAAKGNTGMIEADVRSAPLQSSWLGAPIQTQKPPPRRPSACRARFTCARRGSSFDVSREVRPARCIGCVAHPHRHCKPQAKQSRLGAADLDCFAPLAKTGRQ
jgi:hypothetical protein